MQLIICRDPSKLLFKAFTMTMKAPMHQQLSCHSALVGCQRIATTVDKRAPQSRSTILPPNATYLAIPKQALATSRRHKCAPPAPSAPIMLQYFNRFLSSAQQSLSSTGGGAVRQLESDRQAALLANPKTNKRVQITACAQLYAELSKIKPILFSGAPHEGIQFDVEYYDSLELLAAEGAPGSGKQPPIVCLLHGAPGHYRDFAGLLEHLTKLGIRVIAPNFPDYSATFDHSFRHSPRERLDFLLHFFRAINVRRFDLVCGHSSAVYTMFELLTHSKMAGRMEAVDRFEIKSLGLFSTPSHVLPHNLAVTPFRLFTLKLFDYSVLRPFLLAIVHTFVKFQGIRNRVDKSRIEDLLIAASAVGYSQHAKMADRLKLLQRHKIPAILVYGTRDRLITVNNFKLLEKDLGVTSELQVKRYKADGDVARSPSEHSELVDVSVFESGGHYTFQKYSGQVAGDIHSFLRRRVWAVAGSEGVSVADQTKNGHEREATKL